MSVVAVEANGPVSIIRINRPEKLNAISSAVAVELQQAFEAFDASDQRVAILSAAGDRAFSAGADVTDLPELWRAIQGVGFHTDKPIIAATSGWCVGGGIVMVMMCDLMVSTEDTVFYYPEAKLGVTGGMISSLVARMPHKLAMEMMLLGTKVSAQRAYDVGFVNRVVANGRHEAEALAMAQDLLELGAAGDWHIETTRRAGAADRPGRTHGRGEPRPRPRARQRGPAGGHPRPPGAAQTALHRTLSRARRSPTARRAAPAATTRETRPCPAS